MFGESARAVSETEGRWHGRRRELHQGAHTPLGPSFAPGHGRCMRGGGGYQDSRSLQPYYPREEKYSNRPTRWVVHGLSEPYYSYTATIREQLFEITQLHQTAYQTLPLSTVSSDETRKCNADIHHHASGRKGAKPFLDWLICIWGGENLCGRVCS